MENHVISSDRELTWSQRHQAVEKLMRDCTGFFINNDMFSMRKLENGLKALGYEWTITDQIKSCLGESCRYNLKEAGQKLDFIVWNTTAGYKVGVCWADMY